MTDFNPDTVIRAKFVGGPEHGQVRQLPDPRLEWFVPVRVPLATFEKDPSSVLKKATYRREREPERDYDQFTGKIPLFIYRWSPEPQDDPDRGDE